MAADAALLAHVLELLSALGSARARRMFGGAGLTVDGHFMALVIADVLYLKADEQARPAFEAAGCQPFAYAVAGGRRTVMAYWSAPDDAMESPAQMRPWALLALDSALRAAAAKRTKVAAQPPARAPRSAPAGRRRKAGAA